MSGIVYKIRHKKTGLYSTGGMGVAMDGLYGWSATGKAWSSMGPLKNHLAQYLPKSPHYKDQFNRNIGPILENWEIVKFVMSPNDVIPMTDLYNDFEIIKKVSR